MLLSVIVPVYNIEEYLGQCLDSILGQTFQDFELILIDDGSTDRSGEICEEYAKNDSRIIVKHQENQGLSGARNSGVVYATGEWLAFVDSDDLVPPNAFLNMMACARSDADVIIGRISTFFTQEPQKLYSDKDDFSNVNLDGMNGCQALRCLLETVPASLWSACRNFVRKTFWLKQGYQFPKGLTSEDMFLLPRVQMASKGISLCNEVMYHYRLARLNSITTGRNFKREMDFCKVIHLYKEYFAKHPEFMDAVPGLMNQIGGYLYSLLLRVSCYNRMEQKQILAAAYPHKDVLLASHRLKKWKPFFALLGVRLTYRMIVKRGKRRNHGGK